MIVRYTLNLVCMQLGVYRNCKQSQNNCTSSINMYDSRIPIVIQDVKIIVL